MTRDTVLKCVNKVARWNKELNSYVLNFQGRAQQSSIKNFVISDQSGNEELYYLIFGKAAP